MRKSYNNRNPARRHKEQQQEQEHQTPTWEHATHQNVFYDDDGDDDSSPVASTSRLSAPVPKSGKSNNTDKTTTNRNNNNRRNHHQSRHEHHHEDPSSSSSMMMPSSLSAPAPKSRANNSNNNDSSNPSPSATTTNEMSRTQQRREQRKRPAAKKSEKSKVAPQSSRGSSSSSSSSFTPPTPMLNDRSNRISKTKRTTSDKKTSSSETVNNNNNNQSPPEVRYSTSFPQKQPARKVDRFPQENGHPRQPQEEQQHPTAAASTSSSPPPPTTTPTATPASSSPPSSKKLDRSSKVNLVKFLQNNKRMNVIYSRWNALDTLNEEIKSKRSHSEIKEIVNNNIINKKRDDDHHLDAINYDKWQYLYEIHERVKNLTGRLFLDEEAKIISELEEIRHARRVIFGLVVVADDDDRGSATQEQEEEDKKPVLSSNSAAANNNNNNNNNTRKEEDPWSFFKQNDSEFYSSKELKNIRSIFNKIAVRQSQQLKKKEANNNKNKGTSTTTSPEEKKFVLLEAIEDLVRRYINNNVQNINIDEKKAFLKQYGNELENKWLKDDENSKDDYYYQRQLLLSSPSSTNVEEAKEEEEEDDNAAAQNDDDDNNNDSNKSKKQEKVQIPSDPMVYFEVQDRELFSSKEMKQLKTMLNQIGQHQKQQKKSGNNSSLQQPKFKQNTELERLLKEYLEKEMQHEENVDKRKKFLSEFIVGLEKKYLPSAEETAAERRRKQKEAEEKEKKRLLEEEKKMKIEKVKQERRQRHEEIRKRAEEKQRLEQQKRLEEAERAGREAEEARKRQLETLMSIEWTPANVKPDFSHDASDDLEDDIRHHATRHPLVDERHCIRILSHCEINVDGKFFTERDGYGKKFRQLLFRCESLPDVVGLEEVGCRIQKLEDFMTRLGYGFYELMSSSSQSTRTSDGGVYLFYLKKLYAPSPPPKRVEYYHKYNTQFVFAPLTNRLFNKSFTAVCAFYPPAVHPLSCGGGISMADEFTFETVMREVLTNREDLLFFGDLNARHESFSNEKHIVVAPKKLPRNLVKVEFLDIEEYDKKCFLCKIPYFDPSVPVIKTIERNTRMQRLPPPPNILSALRSQGHTVHTQPNSSQFMIFGSGVKMMDSQVIDLGDGCTATSATINISGRGGGGGGHRNVSAGHDDDDDDYYDDEEFDEDYFDFEEDNDDNDDDDDDDDTEHAHHDSTANKVRKIESKLMEVD